MGAALHICELGGKFKGGRPLAFSEYELFGESEVWNTSSQP